MFIREHIGFLDFDKNPLYKLIRHDNKSWLENVKRFSHNFSTLLFQPPNFFCGRRPESLCLKKYLELNKT
jgi:hypothetical protein